MFARTTSHKSLPASTFRFAIGLSSSPHGGSYVRIAPDRFALRAQNLAGKARLSEANMREGLKLVEQSLLEADVSYEVAKDFIARVAEKALGEKVLLASNPTQQLVGIINQELINTLGPVDPSIPLRKDVTS